MLVSFISNCRCTTPYFEYKTDSLVTLQLNYFKKLDFLTLIRDFFSFFSSTWLCKISDPKDWANIDPDVIVWSKLINLLEDDIHQICKGSYIERCCINVHSEHVQVILLNVHNYNESIRWHQNLKLDEIQAQLLIKHSFFQTELDVNNYYRYDYLIKPQTS